MRMLLEILEKITFSPIEGKVDMQAAAAFSFQRLGQEGSEKPVLESHSLYR